MTAFKRGSQIGRQARPAPQLDPVALFSVGVVDSAGFRFLLFVFQGYLGSTDLPFQVRRAALDCVEFATLFVFQFLDNGQFGHALAFFGLAPAKIAESLLYRSHRVISQ